ncbi:hypothetical protein V5H72_06785 [Helicobacter pylori]
MKSAKRKRSIPPQKRGFKESLKKERLQKKDFKKESFEKSMKNQQKEKD